MIRFRYLKNRIFKNKKFINILNNIIINKFIINKYKFVLIYNNLNNINQKYNFKSI